MREKFNHLYLDSHERKLLIHSLVELKNQLIQQVSVIRPSSDEEDEIIFRCHTLLVQGAKDIGDVKNTDGLDRAYKLGLSIG